MIGRVELSHNRQCPSCWDKQFCHLWSGCPLLNSINIERSIICPEHSVLLLVYYYQRCQCIMDIANFISGPSLGK